VWALLDQGFRVVIAPSFADIFFNNCFKNGVLPIALEAATVARLFQSVAATPDYTLRVDLPAQRITTPEQEIIEFAVDSFRKGCLIHGLDDIGLTLQHADAIRRYEEKRRGEAPWLFD
jgi:3-isopropylmalate/(R)-2-methylmalate dehydratase small subunit